MKNRRRGAIQVGSNIIPMLRNLVVLQQNLGLHAILLMKTRDNGQRKKKEKSQN
jgi:hypothetical protein